MDPLFSRGRRRAWIEEFARFRTGAFLAPCPSFEPRVHHRYRNILDEEALVYFPGFFAVAAIPAARSLAIRVMSFTGTGLVREKWIVPFRSSYPLSSSASVAKN